MRLSGLILRIPAILLLAAAALKAWGLALDPVGRAGFFSSAEVQLAIVEFEIFLGIWLLTGLAAVGAWLTALATFILFAGISFYLGVIGQTSCGCFGRFSPSPWWAFALDAVVIGLLLLGRPDFAALRERPRLIVIKELTAPAVALVLATAVFAAGLLTIYANYESVPAAIAALRGEKVSIYPFSARVDAGQRGETRMATFEVTNWNEKEIRIIGGSADCSCTVLDDLPLTIAPKETRSVSVSISLAGRPGVFAGRAAFLVDMAQSCLCLFVSQGN
jgi:hypothetical protein